MFIFSFKTKIRKAVYTLGDSGSAFPLLASVVENVWPTMMSTLTVQFSWVILTGLLGLLAVTGQIQFNCSHPE
jgi:hypothetical protein